MQRTMYSVSDSVSSAGLLDLKRGPMCANSGMAASCSVGDNKNKYHIPHEPAIITNGRK